MITTLRTSRRGQLITTVDNNMEEGARRHEEAQTYNDMMQIRN